MTAATGGAVAGIVLAAGSGRRFGGPKQFAALGGHRLVDLAVHTVAAVTEDVTVVLPAGTPWRGRRPVRVVTGGRDRHASVGAALRHVRSTAAVVLVHDAAHPLASDVTARAVVAAVRAGAAAAVPVLPAADAIVRVRDGSVHEVPDPAGLGAAQMPQAFAADVLRDLHDEGRRAAWDGALVHASGRRVAVVPGDPSNVHVTDPVGLAVAAALWSGRRPGAGPA